MTKVCNKCKEEKLISEFYKDKTKKDGFHTLCKKCQKQHQQTEVYKQWAAGYERSSARKQRRLERERTVEYKEVDKRYRESQQGKQVADQAMKRYLKTEGCRAQRRQYMKQRRSENLAFKLASRARCRLYKALKGNYKTGSAVQDLGISIDEYINYLESLFQSGMSWNNYGKGAFTWDIDHIIPLSKFDLTDPEQLKQAVHYTNTRPMWSTENKKKFNKILGEQKHG